jgi:hypothetical protein
MKYVNVVVAMPRDVSRFALTLSVSVQSSQDLTKIRVWNSYCLFFCLINNGNLNKSGNVYISVVQTFTEPILCSVFTTLIFVFNYYRQKYIIAKPREIQQMS